MQYDAGLQRKQRIDPCAATHIDLAHGPGRGGQVAGGEVVVALASERDPGGVVQYGEAVGRPRKSPHLHGAPVHGTASSAADRQGRFGTGHIAPRDGGAAPSERGEPSESGRRKVECTMLAARTTIVDAHHHAVGVVADHQAGAAGGRAHPVVAVDGRVERVPGKCAREIARAASALDLVEGRLPGADGIRRDEPCVCRGGEHKGKADEGGRGQSQGATTAVSETQRTLRPPDLRVVVSNAAVWVVCEMRKATASLPSRLLWVDVQNQVSVPRLSNVE